MLTQIHKLSNQQAEPVSQDAHGHALIRRSWLDHPHTKLKLRELEAKQQAAILNAQNASADVTRHAQCIQFVTESHKIKEIIDQLTQ